jgi:hypothetical protein
MAVARIHAVSSLSELAGKHDVSAAVAAHKPAGHPKATGDLISGETSTLLFRIDGREKSEICYAP